MLGLFWLEQSTFCLIQGSFNKMSSAAPQGHNWTGPQPAAGEEGEDPVEQMISRTGCIAFHHAVMECMAEHHDWRKCQAQVKAFRDCVNQYQKNRLEELRRGQKPVPTDG
ncbi:cytochrome c oxidase assembly factor 4 homolog, mitochondrial isoform X5 [Monodelphis domestica]|uniref:cytochrome c oxidase assembly factor 4 homolog, mitochondrial isoform X5 n=1 Tax=Monodelphis domestica TaxID=13616 RepID=UPI0024E1CF89|nr:cytochrome c oxidase assembly factor 4 homolog, mitochondrial isoform X5 [Monodelphis domestica]